MVKAAYKRKCLVGLIISDRVELMRVEQWRYKSSQELTS